MENVIIPNPEELEKIKESIRQTGAGGLHALADFDRTLTRAFVEGKSVPSIISILRDGNYLTPDYAQKANALYDKYHAIEIDPAVPLEEKKKTMREWWTTHFDLLIKSGLNKNDLKKAVESDKVQLRNGFAEFINLLRERDIPLIILSSSGLGGDAIRMYLERAGNLYDNIHIISNSFKWNKDGLAAAVKEPIIHGMNKDETSIRNLPFYEMIKSRRNILLLGDSLSDSEMAAGFDYDNLLKIGFLNEKVEENLESYKRDYDVVILNDASLDYVNELIRGIAV